MAKKSESKSKGTIAPPKEKPSNISNQPKNGIDKSVITNTKTTQTSAKVSPHTTLNLSKNDLMSALRNMMQTRYSDEKHLNLVKLGKSLFHIGGSGHEAVQTAITMSLEKGKDWGWTYYRDSSFAFGMGFSLRDYFTLALGKAEDPATGGRQMPGHFGHPKYNLPTQSSPTGTQFLNAVGTALAARKSGLDEITYVASGEGTTSQGEFYEAINWAAREKLAVLFCIQDNGYAISVPRDEQSMGTSLSAAFKNYHPDLKVFEFDGNDLLESYKVAQEAVAYMRAGKGPTLLHAHVERLLSHSSSDDQKKYRSDKDIQDGLHNRDSIKILSSYLVKEGIATQKEIDELKAQVIKDISEAADWALSLPDPKPEDALKQLWAPIETRNLNYNDNPPTEGEPIVLVDAVNHAIAEEMRLNDKIVVFGEDVADPKGGVFTATKGLTNEFGKKRVFNSPLAEASIIGVALGMAVRGYKPVVEIQFGDYIWPAFMQLKNEVATMRYRSNGGFSAPVVTRVAVGGYIHGGLYHSQTIESIFSHIPGMMIAYPSNAADAKGLLKTAIRLQDPVMFFEHKGMYRLPFARTFEPDENYLVPFGKAKVVKEGKDATIITYGMGVKDSMNAVKKFEKTSNKTIEIIDLRTIIPWDKELVLDSVKKTGRALVVHEDTLTTGFGAEISATIAQNAFNWLDAPIIRLAAEDCHIPFAPNYEAVVLPSEGKVLDKLEELIKF